MLWLRGLVFTVLVPGVVAVAGPAWVDRSRTIAGGWWASGWVIVAVGVSIYLGCLMRFLAAGGTPMIFFMRRLRWLVGEEPRALVTHGLYTVSRNPMYLGVLTTIAGQAIVFASARIAIYLLIFALAFHLVVIFIEEPHLRRVNGASYDAYLARVPRWLGRPR
ncbi:MAG TPA: methyltransferase [Vicinamibacterales bacterium]|nr:methyltransferase [Vicinamibacterales bacterium]